MDEIPYSEFINKELICFSMADNIRSIPSVADGLKPGQRKVIWSCFKRKLKKEIRVRSMLVPSQLYFWMSVVGLPTCWLHIRTRGIPSRWSFSCADHCQFGARLCGKQQCYFALPKRPVWYPRSRWQGPCLTQVHLHGTQTDGTSHVQPCWWSLAENAKGR